MCEGNGQGKAPPTSLLINAIAGDIVDKDGSGDVGGEEDSGILEDGEIGLVDCFFGGGRV